MLQVNRKISAQWTPEYNTNAFIYFTRPRKEKYDAAGTGSCDYRNFCEKIERQNYNARILLRA